jgi:hypothetical protein
MQNTHGLTASSTATRRFSRDGSVRGITSPESYCL